MSSTVYRAVLSVAAKDFHPSAERVLTFKIMLVSSVTFELLKMGYHMSKQV